MTVFLVPDTFSLTDDATTAADCKNLSQVDPKACGVELIEFHNQLEKLLGRSAKNLGLDAPGWLFPILLRIDLESDQQSV